MDHERRVDSPACAEATAFRRGSHRVRTKVPLTHREPALPREGDPTYDVPVAIQRGYVPHLRAADADREAVAELLSDALAKGRLDVVEFGDRLDRAFAARTVGELVALTSDLPRPSVRQSFPAARSRWVTVLLWLAWSMWSVLAAGTVALWLLLAMLAGFTEPWPLWLASFWGIVLIVVTVSTRPCRGRRPLRRGASRPAYH